MKTSFALGQLVVTRGATSAFTPEEQAKCLARHRSGDWGDCCAEDKKCNDDALKYGDRILSSYKFEDGRKLWIITEYDRSVSTLLLPEEY